MKNRYVILSFIVSALFVSLSIPSARSAEQTERAERATEDTHKDEINFQSIRAPRIEMIQIKGNTKTDRNVILYLSGLHKDQEISRAMLRDSRIRIQTSGIFETVKMSVLDGHDRDHKIILIEVKEKWSWFVVPSFSYSKDAMSGGVAAGDQNLFGKFKKGLVFADWGPLVRRAVLGYRDPQLLNTRFILAVDGIVRRDDMIEYMDRHEVRKVRLLEMGATVLPGYKFSDYFSVSFGYYYRRIHNTILWAQPNLRDIDTTNGNDRAVVLQMHFDDTEDFGGMFRGNRVHLETQISDSRFFSDFNYYRQLLYFTRAYLFWDRRLNWINNASIQFGRTLPYYYELMMGGDNLRGYISREFRGDTEYRVQEEFVFPIWNFARFEIRGATFYDTGVMYFKQNKFTRNAWKNGAGAGLRLYLKGIAIPLLGYDFGWGFEDDNYGTYLRIGAQF